VRSRCQTVAVAPPPAAEAQRWLRARGSDGEQAAALLGLAGGAPLRALAMAAEGQGARLLEAARDLARLVQRQADPVALAADWHKMGSERVLAYLAQWATDLVRLKFGDNPPMLFHTGHEGALRGLASRVELPKLFELLDEVAVNRRRIDHNLNPQLLTERLLIQCSELSSR
jgi:DNA polymerase-3 subunit delta'